MHSLFLSDRVLCRVAQGGTQETVVIWTGYLGSKATNGGGKWQEGVQVVVEKGGKKLAF